MSGIVILKPRELQRKIAKVSRVARTPAYRQALRHGVAASVEHDAVPLPSGIRTVLDIGANRGQFAIYACGRFPKAEIHCFEPIPEARAKLEAVAPTGRVVTTYDLALSNTDGKVDFFVTRDDDSSSLLRPSRTQVDEFPGSREARVIQVPVKRLDDVLVAEGLARPILMKLDVQGAEMEVLKGAPVTLERVDFVLAECSFVELYQGQALGEQLIEYMNHTGFMLDGLYSPTTSENGRLLQADGLFVNSKLARE